MPPTPRPPSITIHSHDMPAAKNSAPQTSTASMVWPKSGCGTSRPTKVMRIRIATRLPGMSGRFMRSENAQATITTNAGLTNSEGCRAKPAIEIQRRAPFTSGPIHSVITIRTMPMRNTASAERRIWRGAIIETPIISAIAGTTKIAWRLTKWK